ncbi:hypothetical protein HZS_4457, partial [Henneguya salminicola]
MKLKKIRQELSKLKCIDKPDIKYEQYSTPVEIAANMLMIIDEDACGICDKTVADFGCGCGILGIGASLFHPASVIFCDIDRSCLVTAKHNAESTNNNQIYMEFVQVNLADDKLPFNQHQVDITIMNPPFGTKNNEGIDMKFLLAAIKNTSSFIYSLHKSSTRRFVTKFANELGVTATVLYEIRYNLDRSYGFHKSNSVEISVDL